MLRILYFNNNRTYYMKKVSKLYTNFNKLNGQKNDHLKSSKIQKFLFIVLTLQQKRRTRMPELASPIFAGNN